MRVGRVWRILCVALMFCLFASGASSVALAASKVKLNKTKATVFNGETLQLKVTGTKSKVTWSSSAKTVAAVDSKGKVTAKKSGSATITAKVGKNKYNCIVTVKPALSINKTKLEVEAGKSAKATVTYKLKGKVNCKSSNKNIAACSLKAKGKNYELTVTGKKPGAATITVSNDKSSDKLTLKVTVKAKEEPVKVQRLDVAPLFKMTIEEANAWLTGKGVEPLTNTGTGYCTWTNGGVAAARDIDVYDGKLIIAVEVLPEGADKYELCGVHYGMTYSEARIMLLSSNWALDGEYEESAEFVYKGEGNLVMLQIDYDDDKITHFNLTY